MKLEYKNIRPNIKGELKYYFGWQMYQEYKEVSKEEYDNSKLPVLIYN